MDSTDNVSGTTKKSGISGKAKILCRFIPAFLLVVIFTVILIVGDYRITANRHDLLFVVFMALSLCLCIAATVFEKREKFRELTGGIVYLLSPVACFFVLENFIHNPLSESPVMRADIIMLNIIIFLVIQTVILFVSSRSDVAISLCFLIALGFGIANSLALSFRNAPVFPWDILSFGTAMSVVGNYEISFTNKELFLIFIGLFFIALSVIASFRFKLKKWYVRLCAAVLSVCISACFFAYLRSDDAEKRIGYYPYLFSSEYLYKYNGAALSMIYTSKYLKLREPSGYSVSELRTLASDYSEKSEATYNDRARPNVIVIMNEAFSDLSVLGDFSTNTEYMPFLNAVSEDGNAVKGNVYVSVKGGNTPNSEFEFLTGTSMASLPSGSIPFQQYIKTDTQSFVSQLEELGYYTVAMHPYAETGWDRNKVYPYLSFDESHFYSDFRASGRIRSYVSDMGMYKKLIEFYEDERSSGNSSPMFLYGVTMQNHGSYKKVAAFSPTVTIDGLDVNDNTVYELSSYLTLIKKSDEAFRYLVEYFSECDEPTVILMFGDHQPNDYVVEPILKLNGIELDDHTKCRERYVTPYIMWANFDTGDKCDAEDLGLNCLSAKLCRFAGLPLTPFQCWTEELCGKYPIIYCGGFTDSDGIFTSVSKFGSVPELNMLSKIQYNLIFDTENTVTELFSVVRRTK